MPGLRVDPFQDGERMSDYSKAWAIEAVICVMNAVGKVSESASAYAMKGDSERAEALNKIGSELNDIMCQIEKIADIE